MMTVVGVLCPLLMATVLIYSAEFVACRPTHGNPQGCLLSRLEYANCTFANKRIPRTDVNQFGSYKTRFRHSVAGGRRCEITGKDSAVRNIYIIGNDANVKFIFSPGIRLEPSQLYINEGIVFYEIACPEGYIIYFNISHIEMEGRNCMLPNANEGDLARCVDYVLVNHGQGGSSENCGNTPNSDHTDYPFDQGRIQVILRSSKRIKSVGFEAYAICFRREDNNLPGCTTPIDPEDSMETTGSSNRRKRDLDDFNKEWKRRLESIERMRRQGRFRRDTLRYEERIVPYGVDVLYRDKVITFRNRQSNKTISTIDNVVILHTFNGKAFISSYKETAKNGDDDFLILSGPGPLRILGQYAYFQLFLINPVGITPSPIELAIIGNLTQAQYALIVEDPPVRDIGKRQVDSVSEPYQVSDEDLLTAIMNENACNAILRTMAQATIASANSMRVDLLRHSP